RVRNGAGVQTCALPICPAAPDSGPGRPVANPAVATGCDCPRPFPIAATAGPGGGSAAREGALRVAGASPEWGAREPWAAAGYCGGGGKNPVAGTWGLLPSGWRPSLPAAAVWRTRRAEHLRSAAEPAAVVCVVGCSYRLCTS